MATASTPVFTWGATLNAGIAVGNSGSFTFTLNLTQAWQCQCPILIRFPTNVSAGPQISVYRSMDGGVTFDTVALQPLGLARQSGNFAQVSITVETGQYAVQVMVGGGSTATWTVQVLTQIYLTAMANA